MATEGRGPFSPAAVAALAAGCDLVALATAATPPRSSRASGAAALFDSADEAVEFFVDGKAVAYARERDRFPRAHRATFAATPASAALVG